MPMYWEDDENNDYEDNSDDWEEESSDDWEGDWDSDYNEDYDDWDEDDRDYDDDSEDDDEEDNFDWDEWEKENDWEDQPYDFYGDIEDAQWDQYEQVPWDEPEGGDFGTDPGLAPGSFNFDDTYGDISQAGIGFDPAQFSADVAELSSYNASVPEELVAGPEGFDPAIFEVPEVNAWINDNINNPDDLLAQQVAQDAANAYFELVNAQTPNMLPPEAEVPEFEFDPNILPSEYSEFTPNGTTPEDYSAALTAAAAMTNMPEFAGMSVEEITQAIMSDPDAIANITSSGDPTIDRQTGEEIEGPNTPPTYDENEQIAFGNAQELVDMNPEQILQDTQVEQLPEDMTGPDGSIESVLDQIIGPAPEESLPPAEVNVQAFESTPVDPADHPEAASMPVNYETPEGPLLAIELDGGNRLVQDPQGGLHLLNADGTEEPLNAKEQAIYQTLFTGEAQFQKAGGMTDENGRPVKVYTGPDGTPARDSAEIAQIISQNQSEIAQIKAEQAANPDDTDLLIEGDARIKELEAINKGWVTDLQTARNDEAKPPTAAAGGRATGNVLTIKEESGAQTLFDPETGQTINIKAIRTGWIAPQDENGNPTGERITGIKVDLATGIIFTDVTQYDEEGNKYIDHVKVDFKPGDTLLYTTNQGTFEFDPFRSTRQIADDRAKRIADDKEAALLARQKQTQDAAAARAAAARSAAGGARSSGGSRSSGGGANKNAEESNAIRREELAQRIKEADESAAIRREELTQRAGEAASQLAATYAKLSQDDTQFNSNLQITRDTLQQKIADSQQQESQFQQRHQLDLAEQAARRTEAAQQLDIELGKLQSNREQFLASHTLAQESLSSQQLTNAEKLRLEREALELQKEKQQQENDKPDIVTIGGGRYLQFNKATGEWDVKGDSGFSGSRSRGGSI